MLKKITVEILEQKLEEKIINTELIHSVEKHPGKPGLIRVHYDSRIFHVKEPLDGFLERMNTSLDDDVLNRFKSIETRLDSLYDLLQQTNTKLASKADTEVVNKVLDNVVDEVNVALNEFEQKLPKKKKK